MLLKFVLNNNFVEFADQLYKQICGTAMGTSCAPNYAQLFLALFIERKLLASAPRSPDLLKRYIDDILILWNGSRESLEAFLNRYNEFHPKIKVTWNISQHEVDYLDLTLFKH